MTKYIITGYHIVNGTKSGKIRYRKELNSKEEPEEERKMLEEKHGCIVKNRFGNGERIATVNFIYKQK